MKLNPACVRAVLLAVESKTDATHFFALDRSEPLGDLSEYSYDDILYHIRQCSMASLIVGLFEADGGDYIRISDLSPAGHEFLANVRSDTVWKKVLGVAGDLCIESLSGLSQIAALSAVQIIRAHFGLL